MWEVFGHAAESPVILQTGDGGKLVGGHAYAVLNTTMQGNQRRSVLIVSKDRKRSAQSVLLMRFSRNS
jgi:hypothetical protein